MQFIHGYDGLINRFGFFYRSPGALGVKVFILLRIGFYFDT
jgi:hypothetical protein